MSSNLDPAAVRAYEDALARVGRLVTIQRISGTAPRTVIFSASVRAVVSGMGDATQPPSRTGYGESGVGAVTQTSRTAILLGCELVDARFPLPVRKNDKLLLDGGDKLNVIAVDAEKRSVAGAIELTLAGVP